MTNLQRWAAEKKCCCHHPGRYACAEDQARRGHVGDTETLAALSRQEDIEPCECCCHEDFFEEGDDE